MTSIVQSLKNWFFPPRMPLSAERKDQIAKSIANDHVFIASKSYCPFCKRAKSVLLDKYGVDDAEVLELDELADGSEIQAYLLEQSGQRTVPNIYIKGKHIGGCDDILGLDQSGKLKAML